MRLIDDVFDVLKAKTKDDGGWICQKQNSSSQKLDLRCACGSKVHFATLLDKTGYTVNELYCPECGLSMRSPGYDKDGKLLKQRWAKVMSRRECRCGECMYWNPENTEEGCCSGYCCNRYGVCEGKLTDMMWFCADAERTDD